MAINCCCHWYITFKTEHVSNLFIRHSVRAFSFPLSKISEEKKTTRIHMHHIFVKIFAKMLQWKWYFDVDDDADNKSDKVHSNGNNNKL